MPAKGLKRLIAGNRVGVGRAFALSILACAFLCMSFPNLAVPQTSVQFGSVPGGTATNQVLHLTLRDAVGRALRYNLGEIESGENARIARGQRLRALSALLPRVSAGGSENVEQFSAATLGIKIPQVPSVIGPFSYVTAQATASQLLFSVESAQLFRAAQNAEKAARLTYSDTLDVITLVVGNAYLQVIQASSRITAAEAQVRNAQATYNQALEQLHAGISSKIDVTPQRRTTAY